MATRKPYKVESREFNRGRWGRESFATLGEARDYIRDRWQGPEYIDGIGFHTDYCQYRLIGFTLYDIGTRCEPSYNGSPCWDWVWLIVAGDKYPAIDDNTEWEYINALDAEAATEDAWADAWANEYDPAPF